MKQIQGFHMLIEKDEDESFCEKDIIDFVRETTIISLESSKIKSNSHILNIGCYDRSAYEYFDSEINEYIEDVYNIDVSKKVSVDDPNYGNISQSTFCEKIRKGDTKDFKFKENSDYVIVFLFIESDSKPLGVALRTIGKEINAEYFKYQII